MSMPEVTNLKQNLKKKALIVLAITITFISIGLIYVNDYYRADRAAIENFEYSQSTTIEHIEDGVIAYIPENPMVGFIFYPGGKVEYTAYEPLMLACADRGILCVLLEMPFNLAVLDMNAADGIIEQFSQIQSWYIGGHSLGGSMAASYLEKNQEDFDGLILLGSYSTSDISNSNLNVISIYGSEDGVMNRENYDKYLSNLPENYFEFIVDGGCHAYFGMYGPQDSDGTAYISNEDQIHITADTIKALCSSKD